MADEKLAFRSALSQYMKHIFVTLLTRLQTSKTDNYVYHFVYFLLYTMAIQVEGLSPDLVIGAMEEIQSGYIFGPWLLFFLISMLMNPVTDRI